MWSEKCPLSTPIPQDPAASQSFPNPSAPAMPVLHRLPPSWQKFLLHFLHLQFGVFIEQDRIRPNSAQCLHSADSADPGTYHQYLLSSQLCNIHFSLFLSSPACSCLHRIPSWKNPLSYQTPINAIRQSNAVVIENTATTRVSDQPHNSKWWWIGAILKKRFPPVILK